MQTILMMTGLHQQQHGTDGQNSGGANMLTMMVMAQCMPILIDWAREAQRGTCSLVRSVANEAVNTVCSHVKDRRERAQKHRQSFLENVNKEKVPEMWSSVNFSDRVNHDAKEIRALVWYMMQPGKATITLLTHAENGSIIPNKEIETEVVAPDNELRMYCTISATHSESSAAVNNPRSGDRTEDVDGGGLVSNIVNRKVICLLRAHIRMREVPADVCYRIVQDIVKMFDDNNKGFDYSTLQILELHRTSWDRRLAFRCVQFISNKRLANIFLGRKANDQLTSRLAMFGDRNEYIRMGSQRALTVLLHGPPGTGKTAIIKALANELNRHIVKVDLGKIQSQEELAEMFHPHRLRIDFGDRVEFVYIDMKQRLYVFEEVDLQTDLVHRRKGMNENGDHEYSDEEDSAEDASNSKKRKRVCPECEYEYNEKGGPSINMKDILEIMDGLREMEDRVMVITTNRRDILDPAMLRPGRMDIDLLLGRMDKFALNNISVAYFGKENGFGEDRILKSGLDDTLTGAEVSGCLLQAKTCQSPASGARYAFDLLLDEKRRKENAAKIAREKAETKRRLEEEKARITKEKAHMAEVFLKENDMEKTLREIKSSVGQLTLRMGDNDAVLESLKQQQAKKGGGDGRKKARL